MLEVLYVPESAVRFRFRCKFAENLLRSFPNCLGASPPSISLWIICVFTVKYVSRPISKRASMSRWMRRVVVSLGWLGEAVWGVGSLRVPAHTTTLTALMAMTTTRHEAGRSGRELSVSAYPFPRVFRAWEVGPSSRGPDGSGLCCLG